MKIYKYVVNRITTRGKEIEVYQDITKSDMSIVEVRNTLLDKYYGFSVTVLEIKEINELKSNNRKEYSFENMYSTFFKFNFAMNSDNVKIEKLRTLQEQIAIIEKELISDARMEVKDNPKYSFILDPSFKINSNHKNPVVVSGIVKAEDVQLQEDII